MLLSFNKYAISTVLSLYAGPFGECLMDDKSDSQTAYCMKALNKNHFGSIGVLSGVPGALPVPL